MSDQTLLRHLPAVDTIMHHIRERGYLLPEAFLTATVRSVIAECRQDLLQDGRAGIQDAADLQAQVVARVDARCQARLDRQIRPVINATGIVLHTGLGRAPLAPAAREAVTRAARGYTNLEFDLPGGSRGQRNDHIEDLLCALTDAEAALMVNNNAAAVFLALNTLSRGREAIISRGQLVEIGGSFRIPDIMASSGAIMIEVGTTNRTHLRDYEQAVTGATGVILMAHPSNYRITGFTTTPDIADLVGLAHQRDLPVLFDLGSGALFPLERYDLPPEPVVSEMLDLGVDAVTFSGDKLIGGPQAGFICGKAEFVNRMKSNPLTRVLRCDKLTYAAMEATLASYINPERLPETNTTYQLLARSSEELAQLGQQVLDDLTREQVASLGLELAAAETEAGSGSLPTESIAGMALVVTARQWPADRIMRWMRTGPETPVVGYITEDRCHFNLRSVLDDQLPALTGALRALARAMEA